jgi:hypothetical protein
MKDLVNDIFPGQSKDLHGASVKAQGFGEWTGTWITFNDTDRNPHTSKEKGGKETCRTSTADQDWENLSVIFEIRVRVGLHGVGGG